MCSKISDGMQKHVFVQEGYILSICSSQPLELVETRRDGDTEQLTKHKQLTTELHVDYMVSSEDRYVLCSHNSETGTNSEKVLLGFTMLFNISDH